MRIQAVDDWTASGAETHSEAFDISGAGSELAVVVRESLVVFSTSTGSESEDDETPNHITRLAMAEARNTSDLESFDHFDDFLAGLDAQTGL